MKKYTRKVAKKSGYRKAAPKNKTMKAKTWLQHVKETHKMCKNRPGWKFKNTLKEAAKTWHK